jgi:adenylate cyclase
MLGALPEFNARQKSEGLPEFRIGVGVEYGVVTVGNIGCEDKMDYTIIGDKVNSGSRLEGLNKKYGQQLLISQSVFSRVKGELACRLVDNVQVKGRGRSEEVYTTSATPNPTERKAWQFYHAGIKRYRKREFEEAKRYFTATARLLPGDALSTLYLRHCNDYLSGKVPIPTGENWFATKMDSK